MKDGEASPKRHKPDTAVPDTAVRSVADDEEEEEEEVVELSCNQRPAEAGEPSCVVCGRYGAYICDTYDVDVCSKECKQTHAYQQTKTDYQKKLIAETARKVTKSTTELKQYSKEQRPALPEEARCVICARLGVKEVLGSGKVCSEECCTLFLTPENVISCPPLKIHADLLTLKPHHIAEIRSTMQIVVVGDAPPVILDFKHAGFGETLLENTTKLGFLLPTPVQSQVIPAVLDGSDVLVCSSTGSGKTGAYMLPVVHRVSVWARHLPNTVLTLVLVPTRDVAIQIETFTKELCEGIPNMRTALIVGGLSVTQQNYRLDSGVQIIIATPGRLLELKPDLSHCYTVVLDEFDVLLDPSFHQQVRSILHLLPSRHQTLLFSATQSEDSLYYAAPILCQPVHVTVGRPATPADKVKQIVLWVEGDAKKKKLMSILHDTRYNTPPVLVFVASKIGALLLADYLITKDVLCAVIHGDKTQEDRNKILAELEEKKYPVLVSTNILGRGLNMPSVSQVVLFDMPKTITEYVHQVGRAYVRHTPTTSKHARAARHAPATARHAPATARHTGSGTGTAIVFINTSDKHVFLEFAELCAVTGVGLPKQLSNSPHLAYQRQNKEILANKQIAAEKLKVKQTNRH